jgi:signal transduction histidine kinase
MSRTLSLRVRLTAWYAACLLVLGGVLLGVGYYAIGQALGAYQADVERRFERAVARLVERDFPDATPNFEQPSPSELGGREGRVYRRAQRDARAEQQRRFAAVFLAAFGAVALLSLLVGWAIAGRAVRRLRRVIEASREAATAGLRARVALDGPRDEIRELAEELDALFAGLEAEAVDQRRFVDSASHELRNPLAVMRGTLDATLADGDADAAELRAMAESLDSAVARSERLIAGLLALARSERAALADRPVQLGELAASVATDHEHTCRERGIELDLDVRPVSVPGDPLLLERLVTNLLENAVKFNRDGGVLAVRTGVVDGHAVLEVANTGVTVAPDEVEGLFEPFARQAGSAAGARDGAGLGLAIVRRVAAAHGGSVAAAPGPDGGLVVRVRLPLAAVPVA